MRKRKQTKPNDLSVRKLLNREIDGIIDLYPAGSTVIATGVGYDDEDSFFDSIEDEPDPGHGPALMTDDLIRLMPAGTRIRRIF